MASLTNAIFKERSLIVFKGNETLNATCQEIVSDLQSGRKKLYTVVEELGPFVTEKDVDIREKGICMLSIILSHLPKNFLNEAEFHFIISFYCNRLIDHHNIIPAALRGILALVQMTHLPKEALEFLLNTLFDHVQCQSQLMPDRQTIYLIYITLFQNRIEDVKAMGQKYVYGVINAIDGERDPRNLMLLFSILPDFIREFDLGHLTDEMFEVIACYFPVDFNPVIRSANSEEIGITREGLAEKLAPCLCAIPKFAAACMLLIIDKLESSLKVAKLDSLYLLQKGVSTFGINSLKPHLAQLSFLLMKHILFNEDSELSNASLKALMCIIEVLLSDPKLCESFVEKALENVKTSFYNVQMRLFRPAVKLLKFVALINKEPCIQVLKVIIPVCLSQYSTQASVTDKVIFIEILNDFIQVAYDHNFNIKDVADLAWTDIPQLYLNELSTQPVELQVKMLDGLTIQKAYLNKLQRNVLYDKICSLYKTVESVEIWHACLLSFSRFAKSYPDEIAILIKNMLCMDDAGAATMPGGGPMEILTLRLYECVAKTYELCIAVLPYIVSKLYYNHFHVRQTALSILYRLTFAKNITYDIHYCLYKSDIFDKFPCVTNYPGFKILYNIYWRVTRKLTLEEQQNIFNKYILVIQGNTDDIHNINLMKFIICCMRQSVDLSKLYMGFTMERIFHAPIHEYLEEYFNEPPIACMLISVLFNKTDQNNPFYELLLYYYKKFISTKLSSDIVIDQKMAVSVQIWVTKAVVMKGSPATELFLYELSDTLECKCVGQYVAEKYKKLIDPYEDTLTEENFCTVKLFYKQRIFEYLLREACRFKDIKRTNHLTALIWILEEVPEELLFMHLTKLVPILIESLSFDNEKVIFSTLIALKLLLENKHIIFSDKVQYFIPRFLYLSTYKTMRIRIKALECLTHYCNYPITLIIVYKQDVLEKLADAIDDRKRLVRKAATRARTQWFLVGAPGGINE